MSNSVRRVSRFKIGLAGGCLITCLLLVWLLLGRGNEGAIRIMPLGDSITQAGVEWESYRYPLCKMLRSAGLRVDFVGSSREHYPQGRRKHMGFDEDHEGHWGWTADQVLAQIDGWASKERPDLVLLHLGTNDVLHKHDRRETVEELRQIIQVLQKHNPAVTVLLAQLIPAGGQAANAEIAELNRLLPEMAKSASTAQSRIHVVNQFEGYDPMTDNYDGIHPGPSGIEKMARKWCDAILALPEIQARRRES